MYKYNGTYILLHIPHILLPILQDNRNGVKVYDYFIDYR